MPLIQTTLKTACMAAALGGTALFSAPSAGAAGPAAPASPLAWAPPPLDNPTTIQVTNRKCRLKLDPAGDYLIRMPDEPLTAPGGLVITGGHNVVLIGGEIRLDQPPRHPDKFPYNDCRAVYVRNATGTVHIEGLLITGAHLAEGFNIAMSAPGTVLQLENIRVETVHGSQKTHHADCLQIWGGPDFLRVDRFTGFTTYQGVFLQPEQFKTPAPTLYDLRHVDMHPTAEGRYLYWQMTPFPLRTEDVWADADPARFPWGTLWPKGDPVWKDVRRGSPPEGEFVPAGAAGLGYRSPGYVGEYVPPSPGTRSASAQKDSRTR